MLKKRLKSGFAMPVLGIGTYSFGGEDNLDHSKDNEWIQTIKNALELGYTHIDTAEVYGNGHCEELVAKAIEEYDRKKLFITTKVYHNHFRYEDVLKSAKESISRLKLNYLDLFLMHSYNPEMPLKETMEAMNKLVELSLVKYIGVCNFNSRQLEDAQNWSKAKIVVNQMKYNLWANTRPDVDTFSYCQKNNIIVVAYKLFGRGKIKSESLALLTDIGKKYNITETQLMIAWVLSKKNFVGIFNSMDLNHLKENRDAIKLKLNKEDIKVLDEELLIKRFNR